MAGSEDDGEETPGSEHEPVTFQTMATRNLRRASKAMNEVEDPTLITDYFLRSATVMALLDLADAVRSSRDD